MGQDWKTLSVVLIGAALAGWLMVRVLGGGGRKAEAPPVAVATIPAPDRTVGAPAPAVAEAPVRSPAVPSVDAPPPPGTDEGMLIERDLAVLAGALARDQRIEDRVLPRINDVVEVPGITSYRRAPDFWESAFDGGRGMRR